MSQNVSLLVRLRDNSGVSILRVIVYEFRTVNLKMHVMSFSVLFIILAMRTHSILFMENIDVLLT